MERMRMGVVAGTIGAVCVMCTARFLGVHRHECPIAVISSTLGAALAQAFVDRGDLRFGFGRILGAGLGSALGAVTGYLIARTTFAQ